MNKTALQDQIKKLRSVQSFEEGFIGRLEECRSLMQAYQREEHLVVQEFEQKARHPGRLKPGGKPAASGGGEVVPGQ